MPESLWRRMAPSLREPRAQVKSSRTMPDEDVLENRDEADQAAKSLIGLLDYVEQMVRIGERDVFSVKDYRHVLFYEHDLAGNVGITHDQCDAAGPVWLEIERLKRTEPPNPPNDIQPWIKPSRDPNKEPEVKQSIWETVSSEKAEKYIQSGNVAQEDVIASPKFTESVELYDVQFRLEKQPDIKSTVGAYLSGPWREWSEKEKPRRKTISIYEKIFALQESIATEDAENPTELVWGVGMALWKTEGHVIEHPILEALAEISVSLLDHRIQIRPRNVAPQVFLKPFEALDNPGVARVRNAAQEHLDHLSGRNDGIADGAEIVDEFSPFVPGAFEPVLRAATTHLSPGASYVPDKHVDFGDRFSPKPDENLVITDTWALYARRKSGNILVADIERLKGRIKEAPEKLSESARKLVMEPSDQRREVPFSRDFGGFNTGSFSGSNIAAAGEANDRVDEPFFPKPFNDSQLEIIRSLEQSEAVVVQGPPGTGKTHTIANIICHYLATGRNVLVTAKSQSALEVLKEQIPKQIQPLVISLVSNDREGAQQLEATLEQLERELSTINPHQTVKHIRDREEEVATLRNRIATIDAELKEWAVKQLSEVKLPFLANSLSSTKELAELVVHGRELHSWLPDKLGISDQFDSQFNDDDINRVRAARLALGGDLAYLGNRLPSVNDLPDAARLCAIHEDLTNAQEVERNRADHDIPQLSRSVENCVKRTEALHAQLSKVADTLELIDRAEWLRPLYILWLDEGLGAEKTQLLTILFPDFQQLAKARRMFLARPVAVPPVTTEFFTLWEAVQRAARRQRPFGLIPFTRGEVRRLFARITVDGNVPRSAEDWAHVDAFLQFCNDYSRLIAKWNSIRREFNLPQADFAGANTARWSADTNSIFSQIVSVVENANSSICAELAALFARGIDSRKCLRSINETRKVLHAIEINLSHCRLSSSQSVLEDTINRLTEADGEIVESMKSFLRKRVGDPALTSRILAEEWSTFRSELKRLNNLREHFCTVAEVADKIRLSGAPRWAAILKESRAAGMEDVFTPMDWAKSWAWRRMESFLCELDDRERLRYLGEKRLEVDSRMKTVFEEVVKLRTYLRLSASMSDRARAALARFASLIGRTGRDGLRAAGYRQDARRAMRDCVGAIPCWIMPSWRVCETIPPELGLFDLVIVDEASQCDVKEIPVVLRAKTLLIVGDDKQVSPTAPFIEWQKFKQVRHNYLGDQYFADMMMPETSLFELAQAVFPGKRIMLNEHFRCVESIIRFSFGFYPEPITPLRIAKASERIDPPLVDVYLPHGKQLASKINIAEARAILEEIHKLTSDPRFKGRSIGVISLIGNKQAAYIHNLVLTTLGIDKYLEHKIICGDSAAFQGREADIVFLSMVASPGQSRSLTTRTFEQRFNVAMSRARDRLYLYRSIKAEELSPTDIKAKVISHFASPMPFNPPEVGSLAELCQSSFESDLFCRLTQKGYRTVPHVSVGSFTIDLVVEGEQDTRLAIELDGDKHYGPEKWLEDWNRQKVIERSGWRFWRCWASSFIRDPDGCMTDLEQTLKAMGIFPIGGQEIAFKFTEHRVIYEAGETIICDDRTPEGIEAEDVVGIGDSILVVYGHDKERQRTIHISETKSDPVNLIFKSDSPVGLALVGAAVEDEVSLPLSSGEERVCILALKKTPESPRYISLKRIDHPVRLQRSVDEVSDSKGLGPTANVSGGSIRQRRNRRRSGRADRVAEDAQ